MPKTTDDVEESVKDWAWKIAASAPPLSDDQFHQLHALFVGGAARRPRPIHTSEREIRRKAA